MRADHQRLLDVRRLRGPRQPHGEARCGNGDAGIPLVQVVHQRRGADHHRQVLRVGADRQLAGQVSYAGAGVIVLRRELDSDALEGRARSPAERLLARRGVARGGADRNPGVCVGAEGGIARPRRREGECGPRFRQRSARPPGCRLLRAASGAGRGRERRLLDRPSRRAEPLANLRRQRPA